jgi:hypothetical protein
MDAIGYAEAYVTGYMKQWKKWQADYADGKCPVIQNPVTESAAREFAFDKGLNEWAESEIRWAKAASK